MRSIVVVLCLLSTTPLLAQTAAPAATPSFGETISGMLPMFAMVFLIFYFLVFKPQQKKVKEQQDLQSSLKKGEGVVTSSGIVGRIAQIEQEYITLEVSSGVRLKFERAHVIKRENKEIKENKEASSKSAA